jgi:hypothetical protein
MYGSVAKRIMSEILKIPKEDLVVVLIMPYAVKI